MLSSRSLFIPPKNELRLGFQFRADRVLPDGLEELGLPGVRPLLVLERAARLPPAVRPHDERERIVVATRDEGGDLKTDGFLQRAQDRYPFFLALLFDFGLSPSSIESRFSSSARMRARIASSRHNLPDSLATSAFGMSLFLAFGDVPARTRSSSSDRRSVRVSMRSWLENGTVFTSRCLQ